ncbi:MAG: hypothetical protein JW891_03350 [Candidatus Lokiarchaeota archaeon]|nr:hypothetical protein [Candidatus Lokiarchaeota archaeon]
MGFDITLVKNIHFGVKLSTNQFELLKEIYENRNIIDFLEVILPCDFSKHDLFRIKDLSLPYSIHLPHSKYGIDFGSIESQESNSALIEKINSNLKIFNQLKPLCYILHPESGDIDLSIQNIKKLKITPLAIENMPYKSIFGGFLLGFSAKTISKYFQVIPNLEFCFDLNHAIKAGLSNHNMNYQKLFKSFVNLKKPILYHISNGNLDIEFDEHLPLIFGQYDLSKIKHFLLEQNSLVFLTFETPRTSEKGIMDDLNNIKQFIRS